MGDQNRKTFKYRIRRGGQNQSDPNRVRSLDDLAGTKKGAAVGQVDDSFHATMEDIAAYRQSTQRR